MGIMEPPEKGKAMVGSVPVIEGQIPSAEMLRSLWLSLAEAAYTSARTHAHLQSSLLSTFYC